MDISKFSNPTTSDLRIFALILGGLLGIFGFLSFHKAGAAWPYFWGCGGASIFLGLIWPQGIAPVFHVWIRVASVLAAINTFILMAIIYYGILTPIAIFHRLFLEDPLDRIWDAQRSSYWKEKQSPTEPDHLERQF